MWQVMPPARAARPPGEVVGCHAAHEGLVEVSVRVDAAWKNEETFCVEHLVIGGEGYDLSDGLDLSSNAANISAVAAI